VKAALGVVGQPFAPGKVFCGLGGLAGAKATVTHAPSGTANASDSLEKLGLKSRHSPPARRERRLSQLRYFSHLPFSGCRWCSAACCDSPSVCSPHLRAACEARASVSACPPSAVRGAWPLSAPALGAKMGHTTARARPGAARSGLGGRGEALPGGTRLQGCCPGARSARVLPAACLERSRQRCGVPAANGSHQLSGRTAGGELGSALRVCRCLASV